MIERPAGRGPAWRVGQAALVATAALALLALAAPTRASAELVIAGKTRIELNRGLFKALAKEGVRVSKLGPGKVGGRVVTLPVDGGLIEPASASGWVDSTGGFKFRAGKRVAKLSEVTLNTAKEELRADLNGKRLKIATVKGFDFARAGFGGEIEVAGLRLNQRATNLLNRKLRLDDVFRPGRPFASVSSSFLPEWDQLSSGTFQIGLDSGFVAKLKSLEVEPVPFATSVVGTNPLVLGAPLINGAIYPSSNNSWGGIEGGLRISKPEAPGPVITLSNLGLSLESSKVPAAIMVHTESGQIAPSPGGPLGAVDLAGASVRLDPDTRTLTVTDARATLEAPIADLINETFAKPKGKAPAVAAGDPLGTVSMTMQAR